MKAKTSGCNVFIAKLLLLALPMGLSFAVLSQNGVTTSIESSTCLSCDGSISVELPLTDLASYIWFDQSGGQVASETNTLGISTVDALCPGVYSVEITQGSETETLYVGVGSVASNDGEFQSILECSQNGPVDLISLLQATEPGTWFDPMGNIDDGEFDPQQDLAGLYSYQMQEGGCSYSSGVFIEVSQQADPGNTTTYLICETYNPFDMFDLLAGTPESGGTWYEPGPVEISGVFDPATMSTGLFTYLIDTVEACPPIWTTMYVVENFLPDAGISEDILVCPSAIPFDMTSTLGGTPEVNGTWFDASNQMVSNVFDPTIASEGTYTYVVPGITPCPPQEAELVVEFTDDIDPGEPGAVVECDSNGPIDLFAELGGTPTDGGDWFNPAGIEVDPLIDLTVSQSGDYVYELSGMGCATATVTVSVSIEQAPEAGLDQNEIFCELQGQANLWTMLDVNAQLGGVFFNSDGDPIGPTIDLIGDQTEFYTYFLDGNVCPDDDALIEVTTDVAPSAGADAQELVCETDGVIDLTSLVENVPGQTLWLENGVDPVDPVFDPSNANFGNYTYVALSGNSCPNDQADVQINVESIPFLPDANVAEVCSSEASFNLNSVLGGVNPTLGTWFDSSGDELGSAIISPSNQGFTFVSASNVACPTSQISLDLSVVEQPDAGIGSAIEVCFDSAELDLFAYLSGESSDQGVWSLNGDEVSSVLDPGIGNSGTYLYELAAIGPCPGSQAQVDVDIDPGFEFDAGIDVFACAGSAEIEIGQAPVGAAEYLWQPSTNLSDISISNPTLTIENDGDSPVEIEYTVWVSNGVCEMLDAVDVIVYPLPQVDMADLVVCEGDEIALSTGTSGAHDWQPNWLFNDNAEDVQFLEVFENQLISVNVENEWGCENQDSFSIETLLSPEAIFVADPVEGCTPLTVTVNNQSNYDGVAEFQWILSNGQTSNEHSPTFVFTEAGQHDISLVVVAENNCASLQDASQFITVHPTPLASFDLDQTAISELNPLVGVDNWSIGAENFTWTYEGAEFSTEFEPIINLAFEPNHEYWLCMEAKSEFGCVDSTCHSVFVEGEFWIYAPNAFTPDNDGINDVFVPIVHGVDEESYSLQIFNRWGELVFESDEIGEPWQGNHEGGNHYVPNGTYTWQMTARHKYTADVIFEGGHVTIIR